jgi:hypothetical protein
VPELRPGAPSGRNHRWAADVGDGFPDRRGMRLKGLVTKASTLIFLPCIA